MAYTNAEIAAANATSRSRGAVGKNPLVYRFMRTCFLPTESIKILDFGAGRHATHTLALREEGYSVTAYEFGSNFNPDLHISSICDEYDVVLASNVLNVQSSWGMMGDTLELIARATKDHGMAIVNYPSAPRKLGALKSTIATLLLEYFKEVRPCPGNIFICERPLK